MKQKVGYLIYGLEAVLCVVLFFSREVLPEVFSTLMAFPMEPIGFGLRALSLSSFAGNVVALILYGLFCLLPIIALFWIRRKRSLVAEDGLLVLMSIMLFYATYFMINPGKLPSQFGLSIGQSVGKAIYGGTVYSILIGYLVLRVLRLFLASNRSKLITYATVILHLLAALFIYCIFGACFTEYMGSIESLRAGNEGNEQALGLTYFILLLQFLVNAIPYVFDVLVTFVSLNLLKNMKEDRYSEETMLTATRLSRVCKISLITSVLLNIGFNLIQLLFIKKLMVVNGSVELPILSAAFVLAVLLLSQSMRENKELKDDNDMFI